VDYIDVENIDPKNEKNVKTRFYEETGKTFKNRFIKKLITNTQNNEIFSSEIIVLVFRTVCVATFESYGSSSENFLQLPCWVHYLKVVLYKSLIGLVELNTVATGK